MQPAQATKLVNLIDDMTEDNTAFTTNEIDTIGYDYCAITVNFGNVPADVAALQVTESDTAGSGHVAISGTVVGTAAGVDGATSALPTAAGGDGTIVRFEIDMRGRKRYLDLNVTAGDGSGADTECAATAELCRANEGPAANADSARGCAEILRV